MCPGNHPAATPSNRYNQSRKSDYGNPQMKATNKDKAEATAAAGIGASVGGAGGATVGVLELAAQGVATGMSASLVIGAGAVAGALLGLAVYRFLKKPKG
jgi:outer membrane lipoprotein SlyB